MYIYIILLYNYIIYTIMCCTVYPDVSLAETVGTRDRGVVLQTDQQCGVKTMGVVG